MPQSNLLSTYIRVDASGREVPGTNILRKKKPVTGKWLKVPAYTCCNPFVFVSQTPVSVALASVNLTILCNGVSMLVVKAPVATTTLAGVVSALQTYFSYLGDFAANGTAVELKLNTSIANTLCAAGVLTITVT